MFLHAMRHRSSVVAMTAALVVGPIVVVGTTSAALAVSTTTNEATTLQVESRASKMLLAGESLEAGGTLVSGNDQFTATMQEDGNLVIKDKDNKETWASGTHGNPNAKVTMQADGNLVIYSAKKEALWASKTTGDVTNLQVKAILQNSGALTVFHGEDAVWDSKGNSRPNRKDTLLANQQLLANEGLASKNGEYTATMQSDGNFAVTNDSGKIIWDTKTKGKNNRLVLQKDGNCVLYDADTKPLWSTGTNVASGGDKSRLVILNSGVLTLYRGDSVVWSATNKPAPSPDPDPAPEPAPDSSDSLIGGEQLKVEESLVSVNKGWHFTLEADGNGVIYDKAGKSHWQTGTSDKGATRLLLRKTGNLVLLNSASKVIWETKTDAQGTKSAKLIMQNTGKLELFRDGKRVWQSGGGSIPNPKPTPDPEPDPDPEPAPAPSGAKAVSFAKGQVGKSHGPGATGPDSWGAGELMQAAWKAGGVKISNVPKQIATGKKVNFSQAKPGDLILYFNDPDLGWQHVAMYLGNGKMIESLPDVGVVTVDLRDLGRSDFVIRPGS